MIIFLGIVGELATIIGSVAITLNASFDSILEISKSGYKIEKSVLDEFQKKQTEEKKKKSHLANKILGTVLLFVPGINLINASVKGAKVKKAVMNDSQIKEATVPMTENEKEQYAKMEGKFEKLMFTAFTISKENEEEFLGFVDKRPFVVDHGLTSLYYEPLMPLNYTFDEVKRLNEATTYSYRIGKIDDKNIAIIGIPNPDSPVSRIQLKSEDYKITHTYEKMTEEEAQAKTFTVYPFMSETDEMVQKVVDEIKQSRIDMTTKADLEALQTHSIFEPEVIPTETEQVLSDEQQGPRLIKTIRPQNEKK